MIGLLAALTVLPTSVSSAAGRLTIHPSGIVRIGQVITVTGVGFVPRDEVYIVECLKTVCNIDSAIPAKISSKGTLLPTHFRLTSVITVPGECGPKIANACFLAISNQQGGDKATAALKFRRLS